MKNLKNKSKDELIQIINSLKKIQTKSGNSSDNDLQTIISSINDIIFVFDVSQRFIYVNVPDNNKLFLTFEKFINQKYQDVMPKYMHKQFEAAFEKKQ